MRKFNPFSNQIIGVLLLIVVLGGIGYQAWNARQQLNTAHKLNAVTECQTRVNSRFNSVLKYNSVLNDKISDSNNKDRANLNTMVSEIGAGINHNDSKRITKAIKHFNSQRKVLDEQRRVLTAYKAEYPSLPSESCR